MSIVRVEVISGKVKHRETQAEKNGWRITLGADPKGMLKSKTQALSCFLPPGSRACQSSYMNACQAADSAW